MGEVEGWEPGDPDWGGESDGRAFAVNYNHAVVSYDPKAGAAYVSVRPHERVARTETVQFHENVLLDYDEDGRLLGVEVIGIETAGSAPWPAAPASGVAAPDVGDPGSER